ncbi:alpha/beta hydrolase [Actinomadura sp. 7K507]|uniref:alpha/beta fold hydrolase n=1 Tax=Actinomadura sp. 7K507 TaxID=2530365 RepID=UPI0010465491|nr:alpha/beta hydrolase [Actinomadura sp. 7K507]TDC74728.1 alpha/beta hydrolase [Actinomadura sp. 7K507]
MLLHGTTQTPGGWDRLVDALRDLGHRALTVDLTSDDELDAGGYAETVAAKVPGDLDAPVVVAHSGAGVILPAVARRLGAARQVWLAAFVPDGKRGLLEEVSAVPEEVFNPEWLGKDPTSDPESAAHFLFHDCDPDTRRWALTTLRLFVPQRPYREPVALAPGIPSTYVLATADRTLRPEWCRRQAAARLGAEIVEIEAGHCPHVSRPEEVAAILGRAAASARS